MRNKKQYETAGRVQEVIGSLRRLDPELGGFYRRILGEQFDPQLVVPPESGVHIVDIRGDGYEVNCWCFNAELGIEIHLGWLRLAALRTDARPLRRGHGPLVPKIRSLLGVYDGQALGRILAMRGVNPPPDPVPEPLFLVLRRDKNGERREERQVEECDEWGEHAAYLEWLHGEVAK